MLRLMLLRHAKSSLAEPGFGDRYRPLAERGQRAARLMGRYLASTGLRPDKVLFSPALRARETWRLACEEGALQVEEECVEALYTFDAAVLLEALKARAGAAACVMTVGHNPATEMMARNLAGAGDQEAYADMTRKYPTAALAVIDFDVSSWRDVTAGSGTLSIFVKPRQLEKM